MRIGITVHLSPPDRRRLQAIVDGRNSPKQHVWRARIVLATAEGVSLASVQRIWKAHSLAFRRMRTCKLSNDLKFAAFDVLEGKIIDGCMQRHRHHAFIRFLNAVEREVPVGKTVYHQATPPARRLQGRRRSGGCHQPLLRRPQPATKALCLDRRPRQNHRQLKPRPPSVGFTLLVVLSRVLAWQIARKSARHEFRHALLHGEEVVGRAQHVLQPVDASGPRQGQQPAAGHKMVTQKISSSGLSGMACFDKPISRIATGSKWLSISWAAHFVLPNPNRDAPRRLCIKRRCRHLRRSGVRGAASLEGHG